MKIVVNGKFYGQRVTGVQRYAREILCELDKICGGEDIELAVAADCADVPQFENIKVVKTGKRGGTWWEQTKFLRYVKKSKGVSLNLCNSAPLFGKKIVCIHDVKIKVHPEQFSKKFLLWYRLLFKNATRKSLKIITVSDFSKSEIEKYYPPARGKISVVGNAWQHVERTDCDVGAPEKYGLEKGEYLFSMSSLEPNKNLKWTVETAKNNPQTVFAVAGGINSKVFSADSGISLPENVKLLGYVSDGEAKALMRNSLAFVFPTIYEGFGLPPLEALGSGAGCVIVSDTEVMHEVLGSSAVYISPYKYDYKIDRILKPCESTECLQKYSWKKSAEELLNILKSI